MKAAKTWEHIVAGRRNIRFRDFERLILAFGFEFDRARPYQIRQLLDLVETHGPRLRE
jgi:hypothetical protein